METHIHTDILIVGAGMAGLMAARSLTEQKIQTVLIEKNERVGGRLATGELGGGRADLGAQYFGVRNANFRAWVERWVDEGLAFEWAQSWSDGSLASAPFDRHPRYAIRGGMVALAEHLAEGLDVHLQTRLVAVARLGDSWLAMDDKGHAYKAPALLLTPPVPISLQLLNAGQVPLTAPDRTALERLQYDPCLTGLFHIDGGVRLPEPGALQRADSPIIWIADNQRKGLSPDSTLITVQAGPGYSRDLWSLPDWEALVALETGLQPYKDSTAPVLDSCLERWLHSVPIRPYPDRYLLAAELPPLIFAGDSFGAPRVEGAALSGLAAAKALVQRVSS